MATQNKTKKWPVQSLWLNIQLDRARRFRHADFNPYRLTPMQLRRKAKEYKGNMHQPFIGK